jgi:peptidoglycan/xylan/chitin deacetylase (PgdA/CDA1 family)
MKLLAVDFHYVQEPTTHPYAAIYPVQPKQLEAQLLELRRLFNFVSGEQILAAVDCGKPLPPRACLITFDDGLRCQYENALPVLDHLNIPALFFVCGRPLRHGIALHVHRIHFVRSHVAPEDLLAALRELLTKNGFSAADFSRSQEAANRAYRYDSPEAALVKWYLNFGLNLGEAERFVERMFRELVSDEAAWCEETYMNRNQVRVLAQRQYLGDHTFDHLPLARLGDMEMKQQFTRSRRILTEISGGLAIPFMSYPYGGANAVGRREAQFCEEIGLKLGFTLERAFNMTLEDPLLLARIDTNDAPGGKQPQIALEGNQFQLGPGLMGSRSQHFEEPAEPRSAAGG